MDCTIGLLPVNPEDRVALPLTGACYGVVTVVDRLGSTYVFPDMNADEVRRVLPESGRIPASAPCLMLLNATMAVLSIPLRNVAKVLIADEEVWSGTK